MQNECIDVPREKHTLRSSSHRKDYVCMSCCTMSTLIGILNTRVFNPKENQAQSK